MKYRVLKNINKTGDAVWEYVEDFDNKKDAENLAKTFVDGEVHTEPGDDWLDKYFGNSDAIFSGWDSMITYY